jgi:hypothetical protein
VAQHAFSHVERHMDDSPVHYIQWRFKKGWDREKMESIAYRITPDVQKAIDEFNLEGIWSRRVRAGQLEYEVKKKNTREKDNKYYTRDELMSLGFEHLIKQTDEKIASKEAGLDLRPVTTSEIQRHLDAFGLRQEFGTYGKIRGLSGGQKVKLVLAAAFWTVPHLVGESVYTEELIHVKNYKSDVFVGRTCTSNSKEFNAYDASSPSACISDSRTLANMATSRKRLCASNLNSFPNSQHPCLGVYGS